MVTYLWLPLDPKWSWQRHDIVLAYFANILFLLGSIFYVISPILCLLHKEQGCAEFGLAAALVYVIYGACCVLDWKCTRMEGGLEHYGGGIKKEACSEWYFNFQTVDWWMHSNIFFFFGTSFDISMGAIDTFSGDADVDVIEAFLDGMSGMSWFLSSLFALFQWAIDRRARAFYGAKYQFALFRPGERDGITYLFHWSGWGDWLFLPGTMLYAVGTYACLYWNQVGCDTIELSAGLCFLVDSWLYFPEIARACRFPDIYDDEAPAGGSVAAPAAAGAHTHENPVYEPGGPTHKGDMERVAGVDDDGGDGDDDSMSEYGGGGKGKGAEGGQMLAGHGPKSDAAEWVAAEEFKLERKGMLVGGGGDEGESGEGGGGVGGYGGQGEIMEALPRGDMELVPVVSYNHLMHIKGGEAPLVAAAMDATSPPPYALREGGAGTHGHHGHGHTGSSAQHHVGGGHDAGGVAQPHHHHQASAPHHPPVVVNGIAIASHARGQGHMHGHAVDHDNGHAVAQGHGHAVAQGHGHAVAQQGHGHAPAQAHGGGHGQAQPHAVVVAVEHVASEAGARSHGPPGTGDAASPAVAGERDDHAV
eukprot:jgi/Mesvir1/9772/Mv12225-RA.1